VVASWGSGAGRGAVRASLTRDLKFRIVQHGPAPLLRLSARLQKKKQLANVQQKLAHLASANRPETQGAD
jgi:hypothetical protein